MLVRERVGRADEVKFFRAQKDTWGEWVTLLWSLLVEDSESESHVSGV